MGPGPAVCLCLPERGSVSGGQWAVGELLGIIRFKVSTGEEKTINLLSV